MIETTEEVFHADIANQRTNLTIALILFSTILIGFVGFTTSKIEPRISTEQWIKKIKKKYGEWIVETENLPLMIDSKTMSVKSFEDLIKISEELGKPVIHYTSTSNPEAAHTFYVFDEAMCYKYVLSNGEKRKKTLFKKQE